MGEQSVWPPRADRERPSEWPPSNPDDPGPDIIGRGLELRVDDRPVGFLGALEEFRFARQSPGTVADHIDYALYGAYTMPKSRWRTAHIAYAYSVVQVGTVLVRVFEWAFLQRLSRALVAFPVLLALLWLLNALPVTRWLIPDQWDFTTWFVSESPVGTVELPIEEPVGG